MLDKSKKTVLNIDLEALDDLEGMKLDILSGLEMIMEGLQDVHDAIDLFDLLESYHGDESDVPPRPKEKASLIFPDKGEAPYDFPF